MTKKLYYEDQYTRKFTAKAMKQAKNARPFVVLDQTLFYPTGGGQPFDTGTLNGVNVVEVLEEEGEIRHYLEGELSGDSVTGEINWERRLDHMQQHHGQHLLSAGFIHVANSQTSSFHLGAEVNTIDLDRNNISAEEARAAEAAANKVVYENRPVTISYHTRDEVAKMNLRKVPGEDFGNFRIVNVEGFDLQACSGTHPARTGDVGGVCIVQLERTKDSTRVHFVCGGRVVRLLGKTVSILRECSSLISVNYLEVNKGLAGTIETMGAQRKKISHYERMLSRFLANELSAAKANGIVVKRMDEFDQQFLRSIAIEFGKNTKQGALLLMGGKGDMNFVASITEDIKGDLAPFAKSVVEKFSARGGGKGKLVQGLMKDSNAAGLEAAFRETAQKIMEAK